MPMTDSETTGTSRSGGKDFCQRHSPCTGHTGQVGAAWTTWRLIYDSTSIYYMYTNDIKNDK